MRNIINNLEGKLTEEQVRNARIKTLEECSIPDAVEKGMFYMADLMKIYISNLEEEYDLSL